MSEPVIHRPLVLLLPTHFPDGTVRDRKRKETPCEVFVRLTNAAKLMRVKDLSAVNEFHHRMDMVLNYPDKQHRGVERLSRAERGLPFETRRELAKKRGEYK